MVNASLRIYRGKVFSLFDSNTGEYVLIILKWLLYVDFYWLEIVNQNMMTQTFLIIYFVTLLIFDEVEMIGKSDFINTKKELVKNFNYVKYVNFV